MRTIKKNNRRYADDRLYQFDDTSKSDISYPDDDTSSDDFEFFVNPNNYFTNSEHRTWRLSTDIEDINIETCTTKYKMRIQIDKVPLKVLKNIQVFYICEHCGKVYWDGSHLERALSGVIKDLIVE